MNKLITTKKKKETTMRQNLRKWKPCLMMKVTFLVLCTTLFALPAMAQTSETLKMTNGTQAVPDNGYLFYDSGGPLLFDPAVDPVNANEYNWTTWYQHNEDYTLTLIVPEGKGIKVEFSKLLINNDFLYFYEGNVADENNLISILTCNDYSSNLDDFTVVSHGNMTIRFVSDYHWRDEGWVATISQTDSFIPQPPVAVMAACSNQMVLIPTCNADDGGTMPMQYKLGSGVWQDYPTTGVWIDLSSQTFPLTVTTRTQIDDELFSSENTFIFNAIRVPGIPTYNHQDVANKVVTYFPVKPDGVNDTYYIRWTINSNSNGTTENPNLWEQAGHEFQQPSNTPNTVPAGDIDYTNVTLNTPFYVHFATRGTTCPENFSGVVTVRIDERYVPKPTISFETVDDNGETTLSCSLEDAIIYYTTDGSVPDPEHVGGTYPTHQYTDNFTVQPGTTVNAIAVRSGYTTSAMASAIFIPGGGGSNGNGVYGQVVLLDDREDHSWSYYSDDDQPIHKLNPADVKITYFGNGTGTVSTTDGPTPANNSWTADATDVQVGPNDAGNQFIYLKTLENANEDGSGDYPYTTIPNPFSKRPVISGGIAPTRNICITYSQYYAPGSLTVTYTNANGNQQTYTQNTFYPIPDPYTLTVRAGTTVSFSLQRTGNWGPPSGTAYVGCEVRYDNQSGEVIWSGTSTGETVTGNATVEGTPAIDYRGFYAWRVKRLSSGLKIKINGTEYTSESTNIPFINAEQQVEFVTSNPEGNEVDFEALWAKAFVFSSISALNSAGNNAYVADASGEHRAYERNFVVVTGNVGNTANTRPATITCLNPDGSGTVATRTGVFTLSADTKFEYINLNNDAGTFTANNHYLCFGRGISTANTAAAIVYGISGSTNNALDYTIRMESGKYGLLGFVKAAYNYNGGIAQDWTACNVGSTIHVNAIMGSDYDRANSNDNTKLDVSSNQALFFAQNVEFNATNQNRRTFDCVIKSGNYQSNLQNNSNGGHLQSFYCGPNNGSNTTSGSRYVTVEGGQFASINGGTGGSSNYEDIVFTLRMKGGSVERSAFGAGANSESRGSRKIVVTGGTIKGWIAGGANGTDTNVWNSSVGTGNSYIYVGGNAIVGGSAPGTVNGTVGGNVFGAGRGNQQQAASMVNSNVIVADNADILHNVYGGGNYGYIKETSNVYVLGGTVHDNVFGGAYGNVSGNGYDFDIPTSNVYVRGGTVVGNVYGGSNWSGKVTNSNVTMSGGTTTNVYGGGCGSGTDIGDSNTGSSPSTTVTVSSGTINNNVYGGGEEGTVSGNTNVTYSGGAVKNVFGAGKGSSSSTAQVTGQTYTTVNGGTVSECVYGGGEAGDVNNGLGNLASTVTINGGTVEEDVFGGGKMGKTTGNVIVNVFNGNINGNVFGGAYGSRETVYIAGTHTVNMTGGNVYTNVYGGSRNADDALTFNPSSNQTATVNVVNISGGHIYYQVFAGGFFGQNYGSVYAFIGQNAIYNAPNHAPTDGVSYNTTALLIDGSVWAGADFGDFDGTNFGAPTVEGYSNVYIDGLGYNTISTKPSDAGYMNIGSSVFGCGTSCYAGKVRNDLIFRNYGQTVANPNYSSESTTEPYTTATRNLKSIQFFKEAVIENAHVHFIGQGRINSLLTTEKYALYEITEVLRVTNGSSIITDFPIDQLMKLGSYVCNDVYAASPSFTMVDYGDLSTAGHDNKFRINNGSLINVKYIDGYGEGMPYGEFEGFFYVMTDDNNSVCAYARPKQSTDPGNEINPDYDNPNDGGFLSYHDDKNIYDINGGTEGEGIQMPYENHTLGVKNGEQYFRIWRYGGIYSYRQGVINAVANVTPGYSTSDVVINLPASRGDGSYFRIKIDEGGFPLIDYGSDVITVNAGVYNSTGGIGGTPDANGWMYYDGDAFVEGQTVDQADVAANLNILNANVNANFGLVAIPQGSLVGTDNDNWLICTNASDVGEALTTTQWSNYNQTINPSILFRLTYNNQLTNNVVWDPIIITLEQCDAQGNVTDEIEVALSISTTTTIQQDFSAQTFAFMNGGGSQADTYVAKVVLPSYYQYVNVPGDLSEWSFVSAEWLPNQGDEQHPITEFNNAWKAGSGYVQNPYANNMFSMQIQPSYNFDNTLGWTSFDNTAYDLQTLQNNNQHPLLSSTDGRNAAAFDFILHFDGRASCTDETYMGTLRVTLHLTNYKGSDHIDNEKDLIIDVEVWRRGERHIYFLDGVNGNNYFRGTEPNTPKLTLNGIFNHSTYKPGDIIFVVNTVTADGLDWNGEQYNNVIIYRYPGGHPKYPSILPTEVYVDYDDYNPGNLGFTGPLLNVVSSMSMHGIILDGSYDIAVGHPDSYLAPIDEETDANSYQVPTSPLINIAKDATLTVYGSSELKWNYSNCDGGAIYNAGNLIIHNGSSIYNNAVLSNSYNGAGVYLDEGATLIVSDSVTINNNHIVTTGSTGRNNNVYLSAASSVVQVGTIDPNDVLGLLDDRSRIGVTKGEWGQYYYTPIAYSDGGMEYLSNLIPADPEHAQAGDFLVFDDELYYHLLTLNDTPGYEPNYDYLFWVGTWVTTVRTEPANFNANDIDTPEELAWAISIVNGLNTVPSPLNSTNFNITADIDMKARIWVPMGTSDNPYLGHFNANGHLIEGVRSPLNSENMGMFGNVGNNANIENMVLVVDFSGGNSVNMAAVAANMTGGTISNVEAAGTVTGTSTTEVMGGIVANKTGGEVHSSFAVNTITTTNADSDMGGLVGINAGDLINSYSNVIMSGADRIGGLAGVNRGRIENCYVVLGDQTFPPFAYDNTGHNINYCYAADGISDYVTSGKEGSLVDPGNYAEVEEDIKSLNYMYYDNLVTLNGGGSNNYVPAVNEEDTYLEHTYLEDNHTVVWRGLLSVLNQWVRAHSGYTSWDRPVTAYVNGDLPVLDFPADSCLATLNSDGRFLRYSPNLDVLLSKYNDNGAGEEEPAASIFVYGTVSEVALVPEDNVHVSVNEDAVLLQTADAQPFDNVTVGITFDNSCRSARDYWGNQLFYDWHFMSSVLDEAPINATYGSATGYGGPVTISDMDANCYFPNNLISEDNPAIDGNIKWDLYTYFEPEYHWINLKRGGDDHWHIDGDHDQIQYESGQEGLGVLENETIFVPGKGYMMAISRDTYMNSTGTLNPYDVSISLTNLEPEGINYNRGWNLVGNPFQAYLDINVLNRNIYVYDADQGVYAPYTPGSSENPAIPSRYIHPHQAFFVYDREGGENLVFTKTMAKTTSLPSSHFRGDNHVNYPLVNLFVENKQGNRDMTVIEFNRPELGGATKMDFLINANFKIAAHINGHNYGLVFTPEGTERVPVRFMTNQNDTFTLRWSTHNGDFTSLRLVDNKTGVNYDMLANDHYTFEASVDDYASRFYITYTVTGLDENVTDGNDSFAYFDGNEWVINGKGHLDVIDVTGHVLFTKQLDKEQNRINLNGYAKGVYLLRMVDNKVVRTQKVIVK